MEAVMKFSFMDEYAIDYFLGMWDYRIGLSEAENSSSSVNEEENSDQHDENQKDSMSF